MARAVFDVPQEKPDGIDYDAEAAQALLRRARFDGTHMSDGLVVSSATQQEWDEAVAKFRGV